MKKTALIILLLVTYFGYGQSEKNNIEVIKRKIEEYKKSSGKIHFQAFNKNYTDIASFLENSKNNLLISSHVTLDNSPENNISFVTPQKKSGTYLLENNKTGILQINQKIYAIKGILELKVIGNKITGTFSGELHEIKNNKVKASEQSSGKISGTFSS